MNNQEQEYRSFLYKSIFRAVIYFLLIIGGLIFLNQFFGDEWREWIEPLKAYPELMFTIFLASETLIGVLPPEFFIVWAIDENIYQYVLYVLILALISMTGGLINFGIGKVILQSRGFRRFFLKVIRKYGPLYQRWGGVIIIISAFTHLPFAGISLVSGAMDFPFKKFILFASLRIVRFAIYGYVLWQVHGF